MKASAAKSGKSARIATKLAPPCSLPSCPSRAGTSRSEIPPSPTASSTVWSTTPIASRCAESPCEKTLTHPGIKVRNDPHLLYEGAGAKGLPPLSPAPQIPADPASASLRTISLDDSEHLLHNHHASVASLRLLFTFTPECRSPSLRNRCSPSPEYPKVISSSSGSRNGQAIRPIPEGPGECAGRVRGTGYRFRLFPRQPRSDHSGRPAHVPDHWRHGR